MDSLPNAGHTGVRLKQDPDHWFSGPRENSLQTSPIVPNCGLKQPCVWKKTQVWKRTRFRIHRRTSHTATTANNNKSGLGLLRCHGVTVNYGARLDADLTTDVFKNTYMHLRLLTFALFTESCSFNWFSALFASSCDSNAKKKKTEVGFSFGLVLNHTNSISQHGDVTALETRGLCNPLRYAVLLPLLFLRAHF